MKRFKIIAITLLSAITTFIISFQSTAYAGFTVFPTRVYLDKLNKTESITITNLDKNNKVTVQIDPVSWKQDANGKDVYEPTKDLIVFPKITNIEKGSDKLLRIGYNAKLNGLSTERTYRIFIREIPDSGAEDKSSSKFLLRIGVPLFVAPDEKTVLRNKGVIEELNLTDGSLSISIRNDGNSHIFATRIIVKGIDDSGAAKVIAEPAGWYVLAENRRVFTINVPKDSCLKAKEIKVEAYAEKVLIAGSTLQIDKDICADKPKPTAETPNQQEQPIPTKGYE